MGGRLAKSLINPPSSSLKLVSLKGILGAGESLRAAMLELPMLPQVIYIFQELAATREWAISGKPRAVPKTVDLINNARTYDPNTGYIHRGFEQFIRRRCVDHNVLGRTAFSVRNLDSKSDAIFEYIDPLKLSFQRVSYQVDRPVHPEDKVWRYFSQFEYRDKEIFLNHPFPVGTNFFMSPLLMVYSTALLAWLLGQHDMASLDGRKIRDMFLVDTGLYDAIEEGLKVQAALWAGGNPADLGLPIVEVNNAAGRKLADMVFQLGLSKVPDNFNRKDFDFWYANQLSATFGVALRHFFSSEENSNRATEIVQEQRQQQKGPAAFIRSEQRMINASGLMSVYASDLHPCRFTFVEEVDTATMKDKAETLERNARAISMVMKSLGATVDLDSYTAWMQSLGVLPPEVKLIKGKEPEKAVEGDGAQMNQPGEITQPSDAEKVPEDAATEEAKAKAYAKAMDALVRKTGYDEICMTSGYEIIEHRKRMFVRGDKKKKVNLEDSIQKIQSQYLIAIKDIKDANQVAMRELFVYDEQKVVNWVMELADEKLQKAAELAITNCLNQVQLSDDEQEWVDRALLAIEIEPA